MDERWAVATARIAALNLIVSFFAGGVKNEPMSARAQLMTHASTYVRTYYRVVVRGVVSLLDYVYLGKVKLENYGKQRDLLDQI